MKVMYVYVLRCADESYYTGVTNNLERKFEEHEQGINRNCYTYIRRPLKIVFYEMFNDPIKAIDFEKKIKGWNRKKKEALINEQFHLLPELSRSTANARSSTNSD